MQLFLGILGVLVGLVGGIALGYWLGSLVRGHAKRYWALNGAAVVVCVVLDFIGLVTAQDWLALGAVGLMAGLITGLKYGYAESIGIWRLFDTWTGTDEELRPPKEPPRNR